MNQKSTFDQIPAEMTVNELIRAFPHTIKVFNDFGIDSCCGGSTPVRDAAKRDGADAEAVIDALANMIGSLP
jgi:regulator of cell morphogenesis and NO signaling